MTNGKGDTPRPLSISRNEYDRRWQAVFGLSSHAARLQEMRELLNVAVTDSPGGVTGEVTDEQTPP